MTMKVLNALFLLAFALSGAVQYNDPDAPVWIAIYAAAAGMCAAWHLRRCPRWLPTGLLVICLVWIGSLLPALEAVSFREIFASLGMRTEAVEDAREIGGLALVAIWSAVLTHRGGR